MAENTNAVENVLLGETVAEVVAKINAGIVQVNANATSVKKLEEAVEKLEDSVGDAGKVDDVQIHGTSIVSSAKIANIQFSGADGIVVTPDNTGKVSISAPTLASKISGVKVNGADVTPDEDKKVNIPIPTDYIPTSQKGAAGGVASLGSDGLIPSSQLPSYVDDVLEFDSFSGFPSIKKYITVTERTSAVVGGVSTYKGSYPADLASKTVLTMDGESVSFTNPVYNVGGITVPFGGKLDQELEANSEAYVLVGNGEPGKIYLAKDTNKQYRWSGTQYVEISSSLALGETSSTAYAGDKGKANADDIAKIQANYVSSSEQFKKDEILVAVEPITDNTKEGFNNGRGLKSSGKTIVSSIGETTSGNVPTDTAVKNYVISEIDKFSGGGTLANMVTSSLDFTEKGRIVLTEAPTTTTKKCVRQSSYSIGKELSSVSNGKEFEIPTSYAIQKYLRRTTVLYTLTTGTNGHFAEVETNNIDGTTTYKSKSTISSITLAAGTHSIVGIRRGTDRREIVADIYTDSEGYIYVKISSSLKDNIFDKYPYSVMIIQRDF